MSDPPLRFNQPVSTIAPTARPNRRECLAAILRAWRPLVLYQLVASLVIGLTVWPWVLSASYTLVDAIGEPALGDLELARFLLSPKGASAFVLFASVLVALVFVEYSGLIVLCDAAIRGRTVPFGQFLATLIASAPRLFVVALVTCCAALVMALPFIGLGAAVYGWLFGGSDFYFYWTERPARFWIAVGIASTLLAGYACCAVWLLVRWAFAVSACAVEGRGWRESIQRSSQQSHGRRTRLMLTIAAWLSIKYGALAVIALALDQLTRLWMPTAEADLPVVIGLTVALLLLDAVVFQLATSAFSVGTAAILAIEYEQARVGLQVEAESTAPRPTAAARAAILIALAAGPVASLAYGLRIAREFVDHRALRVTAHRAGPLPAPENSLAALRLGIDAGADDVEIDVQQTADGHVVLLHDRDLRRVTGDPRSVTDVSLADLRQLRLLQDGRPSEQVIPTLAEFLSACGDKLRVNVEMKDFGANPMLGKAVAKVLREQDFLGRAVTSSFQMAPLVMARQTEPGLPVGAIRSTATGDVTRLHVDFLSLNQRLITASLVRRAHRRDLEIHVWGVNDRETTLRMLDLGCDNVISREPALVRNVVDEYAKLSDVERMLLRLRRSMRE